MIYPTIKTEIGRFVKRAELLRYGFVGLTTQLIDFIAFSILVQLGVFYLLADLIKTPLVIGYNYFGHKFITFNQSKWSKKEVIRYITNLVLNYLYTTSILMIFTSIIGTDPIISKGVAVVTTPIVNYFLLKKFVFKKA